MSLPVLNPNPFNQSPMRRKATMISSKSDTRKKEEHESLGTKHDLKRPRREVETESTTPSPDDTASRFPVRSSSLLVRHREKKRGLSYKGLKSADGSTIDKQDKPEEEKEEETLGLPASQKRARLI